MQLKNWWKFTIEIDQNLEDLFIWKLNYLGIYSYAFSYLPKQNQKRNLIIWLPQSHWKKTDRDKLEIQIIDLLKENNYESISFIWEFIKKVDWLNNWKNYWKQELIGKNFLILPAWINLPKNYKNKNVIRIDPGAAFGTGSHPSTSLCLEMMEDTLIKDKKILDIGCGSGILSIAARKCDAREIFALDNDYLAITSTKDNINLNFGNLNKFRIHRGTFSQLNYKNLFEDVDVIFCNIIADVIKEIIPFFKTCLSKSGKVILSGILISQEEEIIKILNLNHLKIDTVLSKKDWICMKASRHL